MGSPAHGKRSVIVSIVSDVSIAVTKVIVAIVSGSAAMVSEAVHSTVDCCNSLFLLVGERQSRRPPDAQHPFGHGREVYFWTLIVAISIFAGGGGISVYEGFLHLVHPRPLDHSIWSYVVLGAAVPFEAAAMVSAWREYRRERRAGADGLWRAFVASRDLTTFAVLFENAAALLGLAIAFAGILTSHLIGSPVPDAIASICVGVMLAAVAFLLVRESRGLLIGEGLGRRAIQEIRALAEANPDVEEVLQAMTLATGPYEVLLVMDVRFANDLTAARLVDVVDELERGVRARWPDITRIFIEADRLVEPRRVT